MQHPALIIGCGFVGERLALRLHAAGAHTLGVGRDAAILSSLQHAGIATYTADLDQTNALSTLPLRGCDLYYLAPPSPQGEGDPRLEACLNTELLARQSPRRIVYISTTAVYSGAAGDWVTEDTPPAPNTERGRKRLAAEHYLRRVCPQLGIELVVLRVVGIYGPGRWPLERLRSGTPIVKESEAPYSNRIHVEDLVTTCIQAMAVAQDGDTFNVSDGEPGTMSGYYKAVARAFGLPSPPEIPFAEAEKVFSPMAMSFLTESRRVSNKKMLKQLQIALRYPNLDSALQDVRANTEQA